MTERAPAKINACLFVGETREGDGRHELVSVMQAVDLCDDLRAAPSPEDRVVCAGVEGANIVDAALAAFRERTGWDGPPLQITITKRIPVAAGMAGGSADAAAALRLLAREAGLADPALLREIAGTLGADVPAQVHPGRWLATGAGEVVEPLPPLWPGYAVLVLPNDGVLSTPEVYREFDRLGLQREAQDLAAKLSAIRAAPRGLPAELVVNDLAPAAVSLLPPIGRALQDVADTGADHALVSGSGPTVLGLFTDRRAARSAAQALRRAHPRLVLTEPVVAARA